MDRFAKPDKGVVGPGRTSNQHDTINAIRYVRSLDDMNSCSWKRITSGPNGHPRQRLENRPVTISIHATARTIVRSWARQ
jgi:hypothetical protein